MKKVSGVLVFCGDNGVGGGRPYKRRKTIKIMFQLERRKKIIKFESKIP